MTTDELRAKFEVLPCPFCGGIPVDHLKIHGRCIECQGCGASGPELPLGGDARDMERLWNHGTHASRDAEIEALRTDAQRWRSLVAENNKGPHGKFRICWLDPSHEGFITTDGVSCNGKDEAAIVRVFDAAMQEVE